MKVTKNFSLEINLINIIVNGFYPYLLQSYGLLQVTISYFSNFYIPHVEIKNVICALL